MLISYTNSNTISEQSAADCLRAYKIHSVASTLAGEHQIDQQEIGVNCFNLVHRCSLAVGAPDNFNIGNLIELGAQVTLPHPVKRGRGTRSTGSAGRCSLVWMRGEDSEAKSPIFYFISRILINSIHLSVSPNFEMPPHSKCVHLPTRQG